MREESGLWQEEMMAVLWRTKQKVKIRWDMMQVFGKMMVVELQFRAVAGKRVVYTMMVGAQ